MNAQLKGYAMDRSVNNGRDIYWNAYPRDGQGRDDYIALNNGGLNSKYHHAMAQIKNGPNQMYVGKD